MCDNGFRDKWRASFDRCRFEMARLILSDPASGHADRLDERGLPFAQDHFDLAPLESALEELASITAGAVRCVENPYNHESRLVSIAADHLGAVARRAGGMRGVLDALLGSRAAVEYLLRQDRVDVADFYRTGPHTEAPDAEDLPDGWFAAECAFCGNSFPERESRNGEDDPWPWCSQDCFELTGG